MDDLMYSVGQLNNSIMQFGNAYLTADTHTEDRDFAREMYEKQVVDSRKNWELMNQYNSPSAQRERLESANLNPNLVYGSGGVVGTTSLPQSAHQGVTYAQAPHFDGDNLFANYMQLRQFEKQQQLVDAQVRNINAEAANREAENPYLAERFMYQNEAARISNYVADHISEYKIWQEHFAAWRAEFDSDIHARFAYDNAKNELAKLISEVNLLREREHLTKAEIARVYADISVKEATVNKLVASAGLDYAQASNLYDQIVSRSLNDDINITKFLLSPYGVSSLGNALNAQDKVARAMDPNSTMPSNYEVVESAYDRMLRSQESRRRNYKSQFSVRKRK